MKKTTEDALGALVPVSRELPQLGFPSPLRVTFEGLQCAQALCHGLAARSGWWGGNGRPDPRDNPLCFSNKLCLIHSEVSESMEGDRKGAKDDKLPHRDMREVELADALIRILDLAGAYGLDLAGATIEKLAFNQQRADHKVENREQAGGKVY